MRASGISATPARPLQSQESREDAAAALASDSAAAEDASGGLPVPEGSSSSSVVSTVEHPVSGTGPFDLQLEAHILGIGEDQVATLPALPRPLADRLALTGPLMMLSRATY